MEGIIVLRIDSDIIDKKYKLVSFFIIYYG